jgi:molecular chaperone GrpE
MSDETRNANEQPPEPTKTEPGKAEQRPAPNAEGAAAAPVDPAVVIETLEAQIKDLTDRLLRAHADLDNLRKRAEREKEETAKYAITKFARDVIGVGDNFQRAVGAVPSGAADSDPALKSLIDGVLMTEREFLNVLDRHGIKRLDPQGEPFNPHMHQAVMEQQTAEAPPGTVTQVFQAGYRIEDRCLRPAMVVVAKAPPKPAAENAGQAMTPPSSTGNTAGNDRADGGGEA